MAIPRGSRGCYANGDGRVATVRRLPCVLLTLFATVIVSHAISTHERSIHAVSIVQKDRRLTRHDGTSSPANLVVGVNATVPSETHHHTPSSDDDDTPGAAAVAVGVITVLVLVSILFEVFTESLREGTDEMNMPFINTIFSELTTLGFIGLVLFIVTKLDILSTLSLQLLGDEKHLLETIEVLHMGLFLFIVIFLVLCVGLLRFGTRVQDEWREFERSSNDIPAVVTEYVLATEPPRTWRDTLSLPRRAAARKCHREMVYLALRRRFVDYRSNHPDDATARQLAKEFQRNPDVRFPFNEYLSLISGEVMARLIEIDLPTWVALEVCLVTILGVCYLVGPMGEIFVLLGAGFLLILLNQVAAVLVRRMRRALTPPRLMKDAERLRRKNEWRTRHDLMPYDATQLLSEIKNHDDNDDDDFTPSHLTQLPNSGVFLSPSQLADAQRALLLGGAGSQGVRVTLFSCRLVFLLTALHLSVFLLRTSHQIYGHFDHGLTIAVLYVLFLLPSLVVTSISVKVARDGLYAFNVEHMKADRAIARVMRSVKLRQTLRTLRFVTEMKIYLRENVKRHSTMVAVALLPQTTVAVSPPVSGSGSGSAASKLFGTAKPTLEAVSEATATTDSAPSMTKPSLSPSPSLPRREPRQSLAQARRVSLAVDLSHRALLPGTASTVTAEPPLSPLAAYYSPRDKRSDAFQREMERREIHTIFCLFDIDGSGAVSRDEMASLLRAITHDLTETQLDHLMCDLLIGQSRSGQSHHHHEITFESFYNWCHQHIQESDHSKEELIEEIFRMIDTDASGFITVDEFIAIFKTLGQSLDHDDVRELVYQMDRNDDGKIDLEEFTKMLQKHEV